MLLVTLLASLSAMFAIATMVMLLAPRSLSAISLRSMFVEPLSRWMTSRKPAHVIGTIVLVLLCLAGPEMVATLAFAGFDAAALEVLMLMWVAAAAGGIQNGWRTIRQKTGALLRSTMLRVRRGSARTLRRAKPRRDRKGDNSPEPDGRFKGLPDGWFNPAFA
jgi:hypothetical protein